MIRFLEALKEGPFTLGDVTAEMAVVEAGDLVVTSGKIIPCDIWSTLGDEPALSYRVPPGRYPVRLARACVRDGDCRVALATVQFRKDHVTHWVGDFGEGEWAQKRFELGLYGFGVDSGFGGFLDAAAVPPLSRMGAETLDRAIRSQLDALGNDDVQRANVVVDPVSELNAVVFESGYGDGVYPTFWGLDRHERPVWLVSDFFVLPFDVES